MKRELRERCTADVGERRSGQMATVPPVICFDSTTLATSAVFANWPWSVMAAAAECAELPAGRDKRSIIVHHRVPGKSALKTLVSLCPACHAKLHHTKVVFSEMPPLLLELWREQHPEGHEQTRLDLRDRRAPAIQFHSLLSGLVARPPAHGTGHYHARSLVSCVRLILTTRGVACSRRSSYSGLFEVSS